MTSSSVATASQHLPFFITAPGETDVLFVVVVVFILCLVLAAGILYFTLHSLPENMAHKASSAQLQIISILTLLALFTHNNLFWVAALLLAAIKVPDYLSPLQSIALSLKSLLQSQNISEPASFAEAHIPPQLDSSMVANEVEKTGIDKQTIPDVNDLTKTKTGD